MIWRVVRHQQTPLYTLGILFVEDGTNGQCYTLENTKYLIPMGEYPLEFTVSGRAQRGTLWTPDREKRLPEIIVPGRTGIRVHAENSVRLVSEVMQEWSLMGCIAVGVEVIPPGTLAQSRAALIPLVQSLQVLGSGTVRIEETF